MTQGTLDTITPRKVSMKEAAKLARAIYEEVLKRESDARQSEADSYSNLELEKDYWDWYDQERDKQYPEPNPVSKVNPRL